MAANIPFQYPSAPDQVIHEQRILFRRKKAPKFSSKSFFSHTLINIVGSVLPDPIPLDGSHFLQDRRGCFPHTHPLAAL